MGDFWEAPILDDLNMCHVYGRYLRAPVVQYIHIYTHTVGGLLYGMYIARGM